MKQILTLTTAFCVLFLTACEPDNEGINTVEVILETLPFDEIRLESSADVRIIQADEYKVIIQGLEHHVEDVKVKVVDNKLTIKEQRQHPDDFLIKVYVPEISELACIGSSYVYGETFFNQNRHIDIHQEGSGELDLGLNVEDLDLDIIGSGYVYLEGSAESLDVELEGSGWLRSFGLETAITDVRIDGSGSAEVNVDADLDVFIIGSGDVFYKGHPNISVQITGSGEVVDAN